MRIAWYVRVSCQRQAQLQTIEQQIERLQEFMQTHYQDEPSPQIFRDDGYSGATLHRPGLERLRDAIAAAEFDQILITSPDRLARNYVHQMLLLEELERYGCHVEFVDRPMSQDPHDQLLLQIRGAVAEYERTLISERMRRGRQMKLRAGTLLPWTRAPFGYRLHPDRPRDPTGVWIDEAEGAIVRFIFASYLEEQQTLHSVTASLTHQGVLTPCQKTNWSPSTVRGILTNPAYIGQVYSGRQRSHPAQNRRSPLAPLRSTSPSSRSQPTEEWIAVTTVPALISEEVFAAVQQKLAQNQAFARRNNTSQEYVLRALVSCGVCQLACIGRATQAGYTYYVCRGKAGPLQSRRQDYCSARFIPSKQLDEVVWQDLCEIFQNPAQIADALEECQYGQWLPQEMQARQDQIRKG